MVLAGMRRAKAWRHGKTAEGAVHGMDAELRGVGDGCSRDGEEVRPEFGLKAAMASDEHRPGRIGGSIAKVRPRGEAAAERDAMGEARDDVNWA